MNQFSDFKLPGHLVETLSKLNFETPTPIQAQAIPVALSGRDILGTAQTGTGKTGAFAIPIIARLMRGDIEQALILTPTRELAQQVQQAIQSFIGSKSGFNVALLIGGAPMFRQLKQLKREPKIIVGTPGRINDHLRRDDTLLSSTDLLVLDETDRMLDMGFSIQIDEILKHMPESRQTLLFSATLPRQIQAIASKYMTKPERISVAPVSSVADNIKQDIQQVDESDKYAQLLTELETRAGTVIVFMRTKFSTERVAKKLDKKGFEAVAIHGDLRQSKRDRILKAFRNQKYRVLVATDIAARGLDIPHIAHVINYDLPRCPEDYIHRIGRTARAGSTGEAVCFVSPLDSKYWQAIERLLDPKKAEAKKKHAFGRKKFHKKKAGFKSDKRASNDDSRSRYKSEKRTSSDSKKSGFKSDKYASNDGKKSRFKSDKYASNDGKKSGFKSDKYASSDDKKRGFKSDKKTPNGDSKRRFKSSKHGSSDDNKRGFKRSENRGSEGNRKPTNRFKHKSRAKRAA